jgi:hypothetical protein
MRRLALKYYMGVVLVLFVAGCKTFTGPDREGEIHLSSELFGTDNYYLYGYAYDNSEFYRYPYVGEPIPDIINEAYRVIEGTEIVLLPGFNTPGQMNGFALVGEFTSLNDARNFYDEYIEVEDGLQFETVSDTVEQFQVWVQQTAAGNYVKLLVKNIETLHGETGNMYSEVSLDYTYQPNGSTSFPN